MIRHLYSSTFEVLRASLDFVDGSPTVTWTKSSDVIDEIWGVPGEFQGRLDLVFTRPGKDIPMALVAGRAPDRVGILFCDADTAIKAGDRINAVSGPVTGTYEIRVIPEVAQGYSKGHHVEIQVVEISQALAGNFPGEDQ